MGAINQILTRNKFFINIWLSFPSHPEPIPALAMVDSGADSNFLDEAFASKHQFPRVKKSTPIDIFGIDGCPLSSKKIFEETHLTLSCQTPDSIYHTEPTCLFEIIQSPNHDVILGLPWLRLHQPQTDWSVPCLRFNSDFCKDHCWSTNRLPKLLHPPVDGHLIQSSNSDTRSTSVAKPLHPSVDGHHTQPLNSDIRSISVARPLHPPVDGHHTQPLNSDNQSISVARPLHPPVDGHLIQSSNSDIQSTPTTSLPPQFVSFADVFKKANADKLPPHRPYDCAIDLLSGQQPPYDQIYSLSPDEEKLVQEYLDENLKRGFIRKSTSSAGAPIFFVDKEKGVRTMGKAPQKRLVVNYQKLDKITEKFRYPTPLINNLFDQLRSAKIYTKIDLRSAYNLIRIREGDEWKTAFRTKYGLFEYLVMPFGLANAPAYFQRFVNEVFKDMLDVFVVIYLDDFLIYSLDEVSHREHVRAVLQRLVKINSMQN